MRSTPCKITLEYDDGVVFSGRAVAVEMIYERAVSNVFSLAGDIPFISANRPTWELTLRGIEGSPTTKLPREDYQEQIVDVARTAIEWKCDRCGAVWPRKDNRRVLEADCL